MDFLYSKPLAQLQCLVCSRHAIRAPPTFPDRLPIAHRLLANLIAVHGPGRSILYVVRDFLGPATQGRAVYVPSIPVPGT